MYQYIIKVIISEHNLLNFSVYFLIYIGCFQEQ